MVRRKHEAEALYSKWLLSRASCYYYSFAASSLSCEYSGAGDYDL